MLKPTAKHVIGALIAHGSEDEREKRQRYFREGDGSNLVIGVRLKTVFDIAKRNRNTPIKEVGELLDSRYYEARMTGVSIMDFQARLKSTPEEQRQALFDLYLEKHARINNWDLVDRAAPHVIGGYLYEYDEPRDELYVLADSNNPWERRTAIVATAYFIKQDDLDETYDIARLLLNDEHELVQKAVGTWIREAGKRDKERFTDFLEQHGTEMGSVAFNAAIKKLPAPQKEKLRETRNSQSDESGENK